MQVTVADKDAVSRQMDITVPASEIDSLVENRYEHLRQTAKIKGFRPGQVPLTVVRQRYKKQVEEEVTLEIVNRSLSKALQEQKVTPVAEPKVNQKGLVEEGKDYSYSVEFEVLPEINPKNYTDLKLNRPTAKVDKDLVDDVLGRLQNAHTSYEETKNKAAKKDRITMDTKGFLKGEKEHFPGTDLKNHVVVLGSQTLIPGFEEKLEGIKTGDETSFELTFPKDYHNKDLANQEVRFEVKILKVEKAKEVKLDDKFAESVGAKDMKELRERVEKQVGEDLKNAADQQVKKDLFDKLVKDNDFPVPASVIDQEFQNIWQAQMQNLQQQGLPMEALGGNEDELRTEFRALAERRVRLGLLLAEIAKQNKIDVTEEELNAEIDKVAAQYGEQANEVRAQFTRPEMRNQIFGPLFEKKVVEWLLEKSKITDKPTTAKELLQEAN